MNIETMPRYPAYKDSDAERIGEIPAHWEVKKMKYLVNVHSGNGFPIDEQGNKQGMIPFYKVSDINGNQKYIKNANNYVSSSIVKKRNWNLIPEKSIISAKIGEALRKNHRKIATVESIIDNNCIALEPKKINYIFSYYLHKIIDFDWFVNPGAVPSISVVGYKNFKAFCPPLDEQTAIANFLDEKCNKIDRAVALKEKMIDLLKERKQIVIQNAVTKGLNPDVKMKDSGVEWIGEIPEHWEVKRVKRLFKLTMDASEKNNNHELLSIYTDIGVKPRKELQERGNKATTTDGYWLVKKGDFIVNKLLAWMGAIGLSEYEGVTSPAYDILRPIAVMVGEYYHYLFRTRICSAELKKYSRGIMEMRLRLYFDKFGVINVPYPPPPEQTAIVAHIEKETTKIDKAITLQQKQIEKLKEYKATLINSAVTGKIKVC
ncbi:Type-I restriction modification system methylase [Desulfonema limicola]|uniref:Type-I restriction modification system methylase n=1 Tax=Desulfonema limicola TaxID=45656 RepID=A0A975GEH5_9BACT|nr:Type-I restriction modification system methylase [Desulfonema limicola]